jgi:hypothetical protein
MDIHRSPQRKLSLKAKAKGNYWSTGQIYDLSTLANPENDQAFICLLGHEFDKQNIKTIQSVRDAETLTVVTGFAIQECLYN